MKIQRTESQARERVLQFFYQNEINGTFFFIDHHFEQFCRYFGLSQDVRLLSKKMCRDIFEHINLIDDTISKSLSNWTIGRLGYIDRAILRIATYELLFTQTPKKVVFNEAIDLAKKYGTSESGRFVNGILNFIADKNP